MSDNIISYIDMCRREGTSLQQGMNFGISGDHSVILMSVRRNAPYKDRLEDGGTTLVYEGHDQPRGPNYPNPKTLDQPERFPSGSLTQNGKFHEAAQLYKAYSDHGISLEEIEGHRYRRLGQIKRRLSAGDLDGTLRAKAA